MNWYGSGFIPILLYAFQGGVIEQQNAILTEDNKPLLTEDSNTLVTE